MELPQHGIPREEVLARLEGLRTQDADWRTGHTFSLVYFAGDDVLSLAKEAFGRFFSENALNPMAFPSLRRMETDVVSMVARLLSHPGAAGALTSGGTESILLAVKSSRDQARATRGVTRPNFVLPVSAHPAFVKAAKYFDVEPRFVPLGPDLRADVAAARALCDDQTVLVVGSAPCWPFGVIDPIEELAALAQEKGLLCHVDACVGGLMLPFAERLGHRSPAGKLLPPFDFRVPGVTSMSADLHKYGWTAKGASCLLWRSRELRQHQFLVHADWPGGLFGSPSMLGTRAGGPIAAAWTVMQFLGMDGYLKLAETTLGTARALLAGIAAIPNLVVLGDPAISVFAVGGDGLDVYQVGDKLTERGFFLDCQQRPPSIHFAVTPAHAPHVQAILSAIGESAAEVRGLPAAESGRAAMYGMMGELPDRGAVDGMLLEFLDGLDQEG
jgi:glutamate/tyrosine decarboxylase-like PLP-dependent enzyme